MATSPSPYVQPANDGRFAVWLRVDSYERPRIGRSAALDLSQPFRWLPVKTPALKRYVAPAAFRIAQEADSYSPTYAVVSTKHGVPCIYVRSKTAQSLRQAVAGLRVFVTSTGYRLVAIDSTQPGRDALDASDQLRPVLTEAGLS